MRIDTHAVNLELTEGLKRFAESRVWMAARRHASRVAWAGLWLVDHEHSDGQPGLSCRIDAWLRGIGHVTVNHVDTNIFVAVDVAAARLEQTLTRAIRQAAERRLDEAASSNGQELADRQSRNKTSPAPRLAVVIERRDTQRRLPLLPWLRIKYGVEQVSRVTLPSDEWEAVAEDFPESEQLRDRLVLSLLCWPELIVVLGRSDGHDEEQDRIEQERVQKIVRQVREWAVPIEVVGVWVHEHWGPDCHVESRELVSDTAAVWRQASESSSRSFAGHLDEDERFSPEEEVATP